jgi:hypothetical protein
MAEMLECLVSYCSATAHRDGMPLQYLCYRIVSGPAPTPAGGVAVITLLGAKNPGESDLYHCLHAVQVGGPRAALMAALNYLDAVHCKDELARAQTEIRCTPCVERERDGPGLAFHDSPLPEGGGERQLEGEDGITVLFHGNPPRLPDRP